MVRELGEGTAQAWMSLVMEEADMLCGGKNTPGTLAMFGRMALQNFQHRSVEALTLAIRDGLNRKVYGQLTWPQIAEWLNAHEEAVISLADDEAAQHRFTGDNLGAAFLDRQAREDPSQVVRRQQNLINALRAKLSTNENEAK